MGAPSSSVSCTSSIRVGLTREDGRPTLLEEAGTFNKKGEVFGGGGMAGKSLEVNLEGNRHVEVSLEEVSVSPAFWKLSAAVEEQVSECQGAHFQSYGRAHELILAGFKANLNQRVSQRGDITEWRYREN